MVRERLHIAASVGRGLLVAGLLGLLAVQSAAGSEPAGRVLASVGDFHAEQEAGEARPLARRSPVFATDTLVTGADAYGQVRFSDGALFEFPAESRFRVEAYAFDPAAPEEGEALLHLLKGAMRTVTGAIGKENREHYRVSTPVATIGLRGTHWGIRLCENGGCRDPDGNPLADGLYGGVIDGAVLVRTQAGELLCSPGMFFYVAGPQSPPRLLPGPPGVVFSGGGSATGAGTRELGLHGAPLGTLLPELQWRGPGVEGGYRAGDQLDSRGLPQGGGGGQIDSGGDYFTLTAMESEAKAVSPR
ncbi:MAG: hypothetical protein B0D96_02355 [Candidatus Sedimenticola endophacoides]|nr:MAG: hypothetical protein B0D94_00120 [Candidatus Sedimenticola endophacoides]OQX37322.1 MAG: hypothetical protein B0D96_02355 [Candidatus Sedimenticola endophacoides]OQX41544.1 MAG: hypothetical protein B0D89_03740 [Candidatus Sedimenticola endophacoides]